MEGPQKDSEMIRRNQISKISWYLFIVDINVFIDCWVELTNGETQKFRYFKYRPRVNNVTGYLPWPYDYLLGKGLSGELSESDINTFIYMLNDWYNITRIND